MSEGVAKTNELIRRWAHAERRLKARQTELISAECELANAANELGKWLVPKDAAPNEKFNLWFGTGILQAAVHGIGMSDYSISWRIEPDGRERVELGL